MEKSGKRKSKLSPEYGQPPSKKYDSPKSFSDDEAYHSFSYSYPSFRDDDADKTFDDLPEIGEEETQIVISADSLQTHYKYLLDQMEPQCLLDHFHRSDLFSSRFLEECAEAKSRRRRNDLLIKEIFQIAKNKEGKVLQVFIDALNKTEQSFIVGRLLEKSSGLEGTTKYNQSEFIHLLFVGMKERIEENIEPRDFIDDLVVKKAISFHDHEDITRLGLRNERVAVLMDKVGRRDNGYESIVRTILRTYPKLFEEFVHKIKYGNTDNTRLEGGEAVSIRLHLKSCTKYGIRPQQVRMSLRQIESRAVERFNTNQEVNRDIDALVEECICKLEGMKISSVVIQLLTQSGDSLEKVLRMVQSGKAVDWLLSVLNEKDKHILRSLGVTQLQVSVSVDEGGNLNSFFPVKDCICRLNKRNIQKNKKKLAAVLTGIRSLIDKMGRFGGPMFRLKKLLSEENSSEIRTHVLDYLSREEVPPVWFCLLEEHIKAKDQSVLENVLKDNYNEDTTLLTSDVKHHEDYLKEELELNSFIPIVRSWENEESILLLAKLSKCGSRMSRMSEFIKFVLGQDDLSWFWEKVKEDYKHVWDTLLSSKQTIQQSKTDLLTAQLMNDIVIEEVDPLRLKQYMREATVAELGFDEFETIPSRKLQAQYIMNRLNTNNICDFMVALNRAGYDFLFREIKAGSLAKHYVCPLIHGAESRIKQVYKKQFDMSVKLYKGDIGSSELCSVLKDYDDGRDSANKEYMTKIESGEVAMFVKPEFLMGTTLTESKSPASVCSARDSESGFFSGSEAHSCEIANENDFDDEGCLSISPRSSELEDANLERRRAQNTRSRSSERERMLRLINSDMSVSRGMLQRSPLNMLTKRITIKNITDAEIVEDKATGGSPEPFSKRISHTEEEKDRERKGVAGTKTSVKKSNQKDDKAITETPKRKKKERAKDLRTVTPARRVLEYGEQSHAKEKSSDSEYGNTSNKSELIKGNARQTRSRLKLLKDNAGDRNKGVSSSNALRMSQNSSTGPLKEKCDDLLAPNWMDTCECSSGGIKESKTPEPEQCKTKFFYKRSLSDTVKPKKHLKSIPNFVKCWSEEDLTEYFDTRCSMKTVLEERSVSSPPSDRDREINH